MSEPKICRECDDEIDGWAVVYLYERWDADRQGFDRAPLQRFVCRDCWHSEFDARKHTTYMTDDADELWAILEASGGQLVADLSSHYIPGPCYARVVDGELQAATVNREPSPDHPEYDFTTHPKQYDPSDLLLEECVESDSGIHVPIYLVPADRTPFAELCDDVEPRTYDPENDDQ